MAASDGSSGSCNSDSSLHSSAGEPWHRGPLASSMPVAVDDRCVVSSFDRPPSLVAADVTAAAVDVTAQNGQTVVVHLPGGRDLRLSRRQITYGCYACCVFFGYGFAMAINGASSRILAAAGPNSAVAAVGASRNIPVFLKLVHQQLEPMFYLGSYRMLATVALVALLQRGRGASSPERTSRTGGFGYRQLGVPVAIGLTNSGGYLFFNTLCSLSGVALWSSLIGCYVVVPVTWGLLVKGESRSPTKLAGIACCMASVVLLSVAQSKGGDADAAAVAGAEYMDPASSPGSLLRLGLFLVTLLIWGVCDTLSGYVAKGPDALPPTVIAAGAGVGFGLVAWVCAGTAFVIQAHAGVQPTAGSAGAANGTSVVGADGPSFSPGPWWAGQCVLVAGQCLGVCAWWYMTQLGKLGEASAFIPLVSTYTIFSALLGIAFLGESLGALGYVGMATAAVGVVLISRADQAGPGGGGKAAAAANQPPDPPPSSQQQQQQQQLELGVR